MKKQVTFGLVAAATLPLVAIPAGAVDPTLDVTLTTAEITGGANSTTSLSLNVTGTTDCAATPIDAVSTDDFRVSVDADCLDGYLMSGGGYGTLDEADYVDVLTDPVMIEVDSVVRPVRLSRQVTDDALGFARSITDPAFNAEVFDADSFPCARVIVGVGTTTDDYEGSERRLRCPRARELRGGDRLSVGHAEDPVNTATGSFTDSILDLPATAGVFGLDWGRKYDSGGTAGAPAWGFPFSDRIDDLGDGDVELTEASSRVVVFEDNGAGGFERATEYDGRLSVDGTGWRVDYTDGSFKQFDSTGAMTAWTSWDGQAVTASRPGGVLSTLTSSVGPYLTLGYTAGNLTSVTASDNRVVSYDYDANGFLDEVTQPGLAPWSYENDVDGRVKKATDPAGVVVVRNDYDLAGRVASQWNRSNAETTFGYFPETGEVVVTDVETATTVTYRYDDQLRLVAIEDPFTAVASRTYDEYDMLTGATSRGNGTTAVERNSAGLPFTVSSPGEPETTIEYLSDGSNRVESVTDATSTVRYTYDGAERIPSSVTNEMDPATTADDETTLFDVNDTTGLVDSTTDADLVTVLYRYWPNRLLKETEDELGNVTEYDYDAAGRPDYTKLTSGAETITEYDPAGRIWKVTADDGGLATTTYDAASQIDTVTDPELGVTDYDYDPVTGLLEQVTDPMLRVTQFDYNEIGELTRVTHPDTSTSETTYGPLGRITEAKDENNRETIYSYDVDGNQTIVTDPEGGEVETSYDSAGRVEWTDDALDRRTSYVYDPDTGLVTSETSPTGTVSYLYDEAGRRTHVTDLRGGVTETRYTKAGRVAWVEDPLDRRTEYAYDDAGRLGAVSAPGDLVTEYGYNGDGLVDSIRSPEGDETKTVYDGLGRVLTAEDAAGVVTTNTWTTRGELETQGTTGTGTVEYSYFADGNLEWVDDALNHRTQFAYDNRGRLEKRTDPALKEWLTDYNPAGELISATDPLNRTTTWSYDDAGRLETSADPSGRTRTNTYDPAGQLTGWTATDGTTTSTAAFAYDAGGNRWYSSIDDRMWAYYNAAGDLLAQGNSEGRIAFYDYDLAGQRTSLRRPDGTGLAYTYDPAGRVSTITPTELAADNFSILGGSLDAGKWDTTVTGGATIGAPFREAELALTTTAASKAQMVSTAPDTDDGDTAVDVRFTDPTAGGALRVHQRYVDAANQYSAVITPGSSTAQITKTVAGATSTLATFPVADDTSTQRLRFRVDGSTLTARAWNSEDPEPDTWDASVTDTAISSPGGAAIDFTAAPAATSASKAVVDNWVHDDPNTTPDPVAAYDWDDDNNLIGETLPGGATRDWTWTDGRITALDQEVPGATLSASLSYDTTGRIASETTGSDTTDYSYDAASQLSEADPTTGPTLSWGYDNLGRRTSETRGTATTAHTYDNAEQLTATTPPTGPATTYSYDGAGRRTGETTGTDITTYAYNPVGQLSLTTHPDTSSDERRYDDNGLLDAIIHNETGSTTTSQLDWDLTAPIPTLMSISQTTITGFFASVESTGTNLVRTETSPWSAVQKGNHNDPLAADIHGSTITSTTGHDVATGDNYTPWGDTTTTDTPTLGYRGELTLTGDIYLRARNYDPTTATFTTTDPLNGVNGTPVANYPYHYGDNDPLNKTDPLGLRSVDGEFDAPECRASPLDGFAIGGPAGQGFFDRNRADAVIRLRPHIEKWAGINGIDSFTLAVLIHHEGGNYLDPWRRGGAQGIDYGKLGAGAGGLGTPSVGIAGIQVGAAREVLGSVYCGTNFTSFEVGSALIESDEFSISIAAGYLAQLKDGYPTAPNRGLFLAYAASPSAIEAMERFSWNLSRLANAVAVEAYVGKKPSDSLGISVATTNILLQREEKWFSSSNAMRKAGW